MGFWNEQARRHGTGLAATTPDPIAKDLEIDALKRHLDPAFDTLEIGCGNGTDILRLLDHLRGRVIGIDYAEEMIEAAKKTLSDLPERDRKRTTVDVGDIILARVDAVDAGRLELRAAQQQIADKLRELAASRAQTAT